MGMRVGVGLGEGFCTHALEKNTSTLAASFFRVKPKGTLNDLALLFD